MLKQFITSAFILAVALGKIHVEPSTKESTEALTAPKSSVHHAASQTPAKHTSMAPTGQTSKASTEQTPKAPTGQTSKAPTGQTSMALTGQTSMASTGQTSMAPTGQTSMAPTGQTSKAPTGQTSKASTGQTSMASTGQTSMASTEQTSKAPTGQTSKVPTGRASKAPTTHQVPIKPVALKTLSKPATPKIVTGPQTPAVPAAIKIPAKPVKGETEKVEETTKESKMPTTPSKTKAAKTPQIEKEAKIEKTTEVTDHKTEPKTPLIPNDNVHLAVGAGWTQFLFGAVNTKVPTNFIIHNTEAAFLRITDYFCSGDSFAIYDNGVFIGDSSAPIFDNCTSKTFDPSFAYYNSPWSHFTYSLVPGHHNITIRVLTSPYNEGYGAIRVDPVFTKCCLSINGLTVINNHLPYSSAAFACESFGLKLADIDIYNFNDATKTVFGCAGPFSSAYIKSYWGNTYKDSCLALYTGNAVPGGAISTPVSCNTTMPVLCQGHTSSCLGHYLYAQD